MVYLSVTLTRSAISILVQREEAGGKPLSLRARYAAMGDRGRVLLGGITSVFGIRDRYNRLSSIQTSIALVDVSIRHSRLETEWWLVAGTEFRRHLSDIRTQNFSCENLHPFVLHGHR